MYFAFQGFNFEDPKVLISPYLVSAAMMQPQASLVFRLSYEVVSMFICKSHCSFYAAACSAALLLLYCGKILQCRKCDVLCLSDLRKLLYRRLSAVQP